MNDNDLMALVIAGEIDKMGILYEKYKMPVYAYFFKVTGGDNHASEDLVHTVFYRSLRYKNSFTGQGSFVKWLFRIAHNAGIDYNKKASAMRRLRNDAEVAGETIYETNDLEKHERNELVKKALDKLKPEERELIILSKIDCLKYRDIAEMLKTTEGSIKIKIFRSLRKLKDIYLNLESTGYEKKRS